MSGERIAPKRPLTPNLKRLICLKMSRDAIPDGGGLADGVKFLSSKESIAGGWKKAVEWVDAAILAVRNAAEPNQFKNATDEEIAAVIVEKIERKRGLHGQL